MGVKLVVGVVHAFEAHVCRLVDKPHVDPARRVWADPLPEGLQADRRGLVAVELEGHAFSLGLRADRGISCTGASTSIVLY